MVDAASIISAVIWGVIYAVIGLAAIGVIAWAYVVSTYRYRVRVREVLKDGRKLIHDRRAKKFKRHGVAFWKTIWPDSFVMEVPPSEVVEIGRKGEQHIEIYRTPNREYFFARDDGKVEEAPPDLFLRYGDPYPPHILAKIKDIAAQIPADTDEETLKQFEDEQKAQILVLLQTENENRYMEWREKNKVISAYQPLTTNQRLILVNQIKKSHDRRTRVWQDYFPQIAAMGTVVIIVICLMVFWGDMAQPLLDQGQLFKESKELEVRQLELMQQIDKGVQEISSSDTGILRPPD